MVVMVRCRTKHEEHETHDKNDEHDEKNVVEVGQQGLDKSVQSSRSEVLNGAWLPGDQMQAV